MPSNDPHKRYPLSMFGAIAGTIVGLLGHFETPARFALFMAGALVGGILTVVHNRWQPRL